jgi:hypothetical protein
MKKIAVTLLLVPMALVLMSGCASSPSPEQQARDSDRQREAERQQAEFRKGLPPVRNPGQGW